MGFNAPSLATLGAHRKEWGSPGSNGLCFRSKRAASCASAGCSASKAAHPSVDYFDRDDNNRFNPSLPPQIANPFRSNIGVSPGAWDKAVTHLHQMQTGSMPGMRM
jgi:hypothetical protein